MMAWVIIALYSICMALVCVFSLGQLNLALHYRNAHKKKTATHPITMRALSRKRPRRKRMFWRSLA